MSDTISDRDYRKMKDRKMGGVFIFLSHIFL
jgi:hypothetical protein